MMDPNHSRNLAVRRRAETLIACSAPNCLLTVDKEAGQDFVHIKGHDRFSSSITASVKRAASGRFTAEFLMVSSAFPAAFSRTGAV